MYTLIARARFADVSFIGILALLALAVAFMPMRIERALASTLSSFYYTFNCDGILYEAGSMGESTSPYLWVNSGAKLVIAGGLGSTLMGDLPIGGKWQKLYAANNPVDTDNGAHPQNIFRLFTKSTWDSASAEALFYIDADHFSSSPNRNASNGLLFMSRATEGGETLYYAGIRVDGYAVIKKKYQGTYYTMAAKKIFPGTYSVASNVNLLPHHEWIDLKSVTETNDDGSVSVTLQMKDSAGVWSTLVSATDTAQYGSTSPIVGARYSGIRTDFMDVKFDNYKITAL